MHQKQYLSDKIKFWFFEKTFSFNTPHTYFEQDAQKTVEKIKKLQRQILNIVLVCCWSIILVFE
jgi:hypothetical protein